MPLVSVVIPTYNRSELLRRAVESVLGQTLADLECVVVDDASTDATAQIIAGFDDERLVYVRHENNLHASAARNTGIAAAKGRLVAFLDDDDEWFPKKLARQVDLIQSLPSRFGLVYCWMDYCDPHGNVVRRHCPVHRGYVFPQVLDRQRIGNSSTLLVRREVLTPDLVWDESLYRGNDGDFIRRVCRKYEVDFVPEVLVRVHTGHGHQRITNTTDSGIQEAIKGQMVKLVKFRDELTKYPRQAANIYAIIGAHYSQLGDRRRSLAMYFKALRVCPYCVEVYVSFMRSLKAELEMRIGA